MRSVRWLEFYSRCRRMHHNTAGIKHRRSRGYWKQNKRSPRQRTAWRVENTERGLRGYHHSVVQVVIVLSPQCWPRSTVCYLETFWANGKRRCGGGVNSCRTSSEFAVSQLIQHCTCLHFPVGVVLLLIGQNQNNLSGCNSFFWGRRGFEDLIKFNLNFWCAVPKCAVL